jgi:crossover junction endodeoxyribonuclease RusA
MIALRLPYPPSLNGYWRTFQNRQIISSDGRKYREAVMALVDDYKLDSRLRVEIEATMPDRRRRDIDNLFKAVLDALTHAQVWGDDNQIDDLRILRAPEVEAPGHLWVRIYPLGMVKGEQAQLVEQAA